MKIAATLLAGVLGAGSDYSQNGDNWTGTCATGQSQSPINIDPSKTDEVVKQTTFEDFKVSGYDAPQTWKIYNKGTTAQLEPADTSAMELSGGFLGADYNLLQIHFHWDKDATGLPNSAKQGSEHTVQGLNYQGEVHFVHIKKGLDMTANPPYTKAGDLAVLGFFLEKDDSSTTKNWFDYTIENMIADKVRTNDASTAEQLFGWSAAQMLPENLDGFWRYDGSLTTPGCDEVVTWTVFETPIKMKAATFDMLTKSTGLATLPPTDPKTPSNYRKVQALNGRKVNYYKKSNVPAPTAEKKKKFATKVAFGTLPMSHKNPLTGEMTTKLQQVQKILLCFGEDEKLCMFM